MCKNYFIAIKICIFLFKALISEQIEKPVSKLLERNVRGKKKKERNVSFNVYSDTKKWN